LLLGLDVLFAIGRLGDGVILLDDALDDLAFGGDGLHRLDLDAGELLLALPGLGADDKLLVDALHVEVRLVEVGGVQPREQEGERLRLARGDALDLPRDEAVLHLLGLGGDVGGRDVVRDRAVELEGLAEVAVVRDLDGDLEPLLRHGLDLVGDHHVVHDARDDGLVVGDGLAQHGGALLRDLGDDLADDLLLLLHARELGLLANVAAHLARALAQREDDLVADLVDVRDGLLGLAGEGDVHRRDVDEEHDGADGDALAAALVKLVAAPVHALYGGGADARALLVEEGHAVGEADDAHGLVLGEPAAVGEARLHDEGAPAVDVGGARDGGDELGVGKLLLEALAHQRLADGAEAVGGRREELHLGEGAEERLRLVEVELLHVHARRERGGVAHLLGLLRRDAAELLLEEGGERLGRGVLGHLQQRAKLRALGVGLDLLGGRRKLVRRALEDGGRAVGLLEGEARVRVHDGRAAQVLEDALRAALVLARHGDLDARAMLLGGPVLVAEHRVLLEDVGAVAARVQLEVREDDRLLLADLGVDDRGLAGGELPVHHGGGDADALLAAALADGVEARAVEQAAEDVADLLLDDAGAVVLDDHHALLRLADLRRRALAADLDVEVGKDLRLLAGVQGVVHRLLDAGDERADAAVEAEDVLVALEELRDADLLLLLRKLLGDGLGPMHPSEIGRQSRVSGLKVRGTSPLQSKVPFHREN